MNDITLIEKIGVLLNVVSSSPLFFSFSLATIVFLVYFIISIIKNKRINKYVFIFFCVLVSLIIFVNYNQTILNILDNFFDAVFMALFFPNIVVYVISIVVVNSSLIVPIFKPQTNRKFKIVNMICSILMDLLLLLVVGIVSSNNIDVYEPLVTYSNKSMLALLELNMAIFVGWILINLLISASIKLKKFDNEKKKDLPDLIFD